MKDALIEAIKEEYAEDIKQSTVQRQAVKNTIMNETATSKEGYLG